MTTRPSKPGSPATLAPTAAIALRDWVRPADATRDAIMASGVGEEVLAVWHDVMGPLGDLRELLGDLADLRKHWPDMTLRDALGWVLVSMLTNPNGAWRGTRASMHRFVQPWMHSPTLLRDGWAFTAAGLTPANALKGVRAETLTRESALRDAAGRGLTVPVG